MDDVNVTPEPQAEPQPAPPVPIEETPEIPMDIPAAPQQQVPSPAPMPKVSRTSTVMAIIIFIVLFIAGIFLSGYIRPFFENIGNDKKATPTPARVTPTFVPVDPLANWRVMDIAGISYKLPPDVLTPTCDGSACISQGTYLPGGTRFTVASRGPSAFVTDVGGIAFENTEATISGHRAVEFIGAFTGKTIGGYGFSQMHGFMISMSPATTLEVNHFTPAGINADFEKDDELFTQIVSTFDLSSVGATTSGN